MKQLLIILSTACAVASCSKKGSVNSDEEAIKTEMKRILDDPSSYEPVSFKRVKALNKIDSVTISRIEIDEKIPSYTGSDSLKQTGYSYEHKFRAKNKFGGLVLDQKTVLVFPDGKVIILSMI